MCIRDRANTIKEDLIQVVENPNGTAHDAKIDGLTIGAKTGTAELKKSKDEVVSIPYVDKDLNLFMDKVTVALATTCLLYTSRCV